MMILSKVDPMEYKFERGGCINVYTVPLKFNYQWSQMHTVANTLYNRWLLWLYRHKLIYGLNIIPRPFSNILQPL